MTNPCSGELLALARRLFARRDAAVVVPYRMLDPSHVEGRCHQNAGLWARNNSGWKVVHGWLVFDYTRLEPAILSMVQFNPHTIVENADGARFDPTPSRASKRYPFLEHDGSPDDFIRTVQAGFLVQINYHVSQDDIRIVTV